MVMTDATLVRRNTRRRWMEGATGAAVGATGSAAIASVIGLSVAANVAAPIVGTVIGAVITPMFLKYILNDDAPAADGSKGEAPNGGDKARKP